MRPAINEVAQKNAPEELLRLSDLESRTFRTVDIINYDLLFLFNLKPRSIWPSIKIEPAKEVRILAMYITVNDTRDRNP
uniref:Transposase n=1 Tax=Heterorhabditis bacteriophora TaxID=37862 RepID=A0A1I7WQ07_HETBA